ncbi:Mss4-like protein [Leptodontidium sp. 2 PMI_412]|nr:Mss4-like protein [Leptodontidium sp. 2 PMI_412]
MAAPAAPPPPAKEGAGVETGGGKKGGGEGDAGETITGLCNCGKVGVSFPKVAFPPYSVLCHCLSCRASSGGMYSSFVVMPTKDVTIIGEPKLYKDYETTSGGLLNRWFCGDCGSAVYSVVEKEPEVAYVKGGLFAKGVGLPKPAVETFWRRAEKWEVPVEGAQVVD